MIWLDFELQSNIFLFGVVIEETNFIKIEQFDVRNSLKIVQYIIEPTSYCMTIQRFIYAMQQVHNLFL